MRGLSVHLILGAVGGVVAAGALGFLLFLDFKPAGLLALVGLTVVDKLYEHTPHFAFYGLIAHVCSYMAVGMVAGGITWFVRRGSVPKIYKPFLTGVDRKPPGSDSTG